MPTERGVLTLTLMPSTATDFPLLTAVVSLPTPVLPPPSLPGPPRDSMVLSATTMARGPLTLMLSTATTAMALESTTTTCTPASLATTTPTVFPDAPSLP